MCDLETSRMRRPWPALSRSATGKKKFNDTCMITNKELPENGNKLSKCEI